MKYPANLNKGDIIGVTAPSAGIVKEKDIPKLDNVKPNLECLGYRYIETENVRTDENGRSSSGSKRAKEFMSLYENKDVKAIISAAGGDFMPEILDYLDFEKIKTLEPKWFMGYSDNTNLTYILPTMCDIATIYGSNIKSFGVRDMERSEKDALRLMSGEEIVQESFEKCEENWYIKLLNGEETEDLLDPLAGDIYNDTVEWKNLNGEKKITFEGRCIGGCFDVVVNLIGTKFDKVKEYIDRYKADGIVWFLEVFEMSTPMILNRLWQMKNSGYFESCKGVIFGRSLMVRVDYDMEVKDALKTIFNELSIPVIYDADVGHLAPSINIVTGSIIKVESENGKGKIETFFR